MDDDSIEIISAVFLPMNILRVILDYVLKRRDLLFFSVDLVFTSKVLFCVCVCLCVFFRMVVFDCTMDSVMHLMNRISTLSCRAKAMFMLPER